MAKALTLCKVLKDFPCSNDGVTLIELVADQEAEIAADLVEGLTAGGYVEAIAAADVVADPAPTAAQVKAAKKAAAAAESAE